MAWLSSVASIMTVVGNAQAGSAARQAGSAAQAEKNFEAAQLQSQAGQVVAASQRTAGEQLRQSKLVASRILALAAAGGGGASDPTVNVLLARNANEGAYRAQVALYDGEEKARQLRMGASAKGVEGLLAKAGGLNTASAYYSKAAGGALSGYAKSNPGLFTKYGGGGPGNLTDGISFE